MSTNAQVFITGTATFMPNAPVGNDDIEKVLGQAGSRPSRARPVVLRNNGIKRRFYAIDPATGAPTHTNAQLTAEAIRALCDEEFTLDQIDCLVAGTSTPDQLTPGHGVMVHGALGEWGGHDHEVVTTAGICLAGLTSLKYAWLSVLAGESRAAVATGSELLSTLTHARNFKAECDERVHALDTRPELAFEKDFLRWMLSDGAGALLLRNRPRRQGLSLRIDWIDMGSHAHLLPTCMYQGASKREDGSVQGWALHAQSDWLTQSLFAIKQDVRLLNENVVEHTLVQPLRKLIARRKLTAESIDWFLPHMSSEFFRQPIARGMESLGFGIPQERWFTNLSSMGNTGSAAIYLMIDELLRSGRLRAGQRLLGFVPESGRFSGGLMHLTVVAPELSPHECDHA